MHITMIILIGIIILTEISMTMNNKNNNNSCLACDLRARLQISQLMCNILMTHNLQLS